MKQCPNCKNQTVDSAVFCPVCGTAIDAFHSFPEPYPPQIPIETRVDLTKKIIVNPYDHTNAFDATDIAHNKLYCMAVYLLDAIGIIIALLGAKNSQYTMFHIRQGIKFCIVEALLILIASIFVWTVLAPIVSAMLLFAILIIKCICFFHVCSEKAIEPALIRNLKFMK